MRIWIRYFTVRWSELDSGARSLRAAHAAIAMVDMRSVGYLWICALSGRRDWMSRGAFVVLTLQGVGVAIGRGDRPLAPLQKRLGDPSQRQIVSRSSPSTPRSLGSIRRAAWRDPISHHRERSMRHTANANGQEAQITPTPPPTPPGTLSPESTSAAVLSGDQLAAGTVREVTYTVRVRKPGTQCC